MKKLIFLVVATICTATVVSAQDTSGQKMHKAGQGKMDHKMKDCVMMKDGKVMVMKDGKKTEMMEDVTLSNGSTVTKDGTVRSADGTTKTLKNGEFVDMDGKWGSMDKMKMKEKGHKAKDSADNRL